MLRIRIIEHLVNDEPRGCDTRWLPDQETRDLDEEIVWLIRDNRLFFGHDPALAESTDVRVIDLRYERLITAAQPARPGDRVDIVMVDGKLLHCANFQSSELIYTRTSN